MDDSCIYLLRSYASGTDGVVSQIDVEAADAELFLEKISKLKLDFLLQHCYFEKWSDGVLQGQSNPTVKPFSDKVILLKVAELFIKIHT